MEGDPSNAGQSRTPALLSSLNEIAETHQEEQDIERTDSTRAKRPSTEPGIERGANQRLEYELQQISQHQELKRELKVTLANPDDISEWDSKLFLDGRGDVNTIALNIRFPPRYPQQQPKVVMKPPLIFHPDVNRKTGFVTIEDWEPQYTILSLLLQLRDTFGSAVNPSESYSSPKKDDHISVAHTAKSSDLRAFAKDFNTNNLEQGKMPLATDREDEVTESMDALEESADKDDKGFMLFSRVKAGHEVDQKGKDIGAESLQIREVEDAEVPEEQHLERDKAIEESIQQKLQENNNSEIVVELNQDQEQSLEGNLHLQMFQRDLMDTHPSKTLETMNKWTVDADTVDKSAHGVNSLIDKMKNDHAQPSQSRLKNQSTRQNAAGSINANSRMLQDSRASGSNAHQ